MTPMSRRLRVALIVWLAMLGADFVLNAALFADIYRQSAGFLLAPADAFRRIPLGYAAFLVLAIAVVEIASRLGVTTTSGGLRFGLATGATLAAAWSLGLYSIATLSAAAAVALAGDLARAAHGRRCGRWLRPRSGIAARPHVKRDRARSRRWDHGHRAAVVRHRPHPDVVVMDTCRERLDHGRLIRTSCEGLASIATTPNPCSPTRTVRG